MPTNCLPFKWDYISLSLIKLALKNQFSCPSPLLPQYHLIYKNPIMWQNWYQGLKTIPKFLRKSEKTVWKDSQKIYNLYLKKFFDWLNFLRFVEKNLPSINLALSRLSEWFTKNPEILKNVWKVCLKRYPKYPCFSVRTFWTDWIVYSS